MSHKVILICDPGIDGAFAIALALLDPELDVLGVLATAGNVPAERATQNVHVLVETFDPPKLPQLGAALPVQYEMDGTRLHGPDGLGGLNLSSTRLHQPPPSDKVLVELIRDHPHQTSILVLGPATVLARALDRDSDLPRLIERVIVLGGSWHEPGNATAVAEFHFYCDPPAARQVLQCGAPIILVPLDAMRKFVLPPADLLDLPAAGTRTVHILSQIVPFGIGATANLYGVEGFHLKDVVGLAAVSRPNLLSMTPRYADVETRGELTRGMSVIDTRWTCKHKPNVEMVDGVDVPGLREYFLETLHRAQ